MTVPPISKNPFPPGFDISNFDISNLPLLDQQLISGLRGDFKTGQKITDELKRLSPTCNKAAFNRAWYEMRNGNLFEGLKNLDAGRWEKVFGDPPLPTTKPIYRNEDLNGKYVLMCSEGGLGDEIINARFVNDFATRGAKVTLTCDPGLASVFSRIKGVSAVVGHRRTPEIYHDYWVPGMSAARILEYEYKDLTGDPYLTVDPEYKKKWAEYFVKNLPKNKKRIGLRFYGNPKFEHEQFRRFNPADLIQAVESVIGDAPWINLQKEETTLPIENWEDTLAILDQLDLVITSCTSVAHASAALGKPTWVIVPILPYYIWAYPTNNSAWYKSVILFRQEKFQDWSSVFKNIRSELSNLNWFQTK